MAHREVECMCVCECVCSSAVAGRFDVRARVERTDSDQPSAVQRNARVNIHTRRQQHCIAFVRAHTLNVHTRKCMCVRFYVSCIHMCIVQPVVP